MKFSSRYALVVKEAFTCMKNAKINIVMYKNSSNLANGNFGYIELLEAIEPNNNFQVNIESHHRGISNSVRMPSLNVQKTDVCNFISTDLLFVPLIRRIFDLEKFCPIAKGKHIVYKDTIVSKYRPYIPLGCWMIITKITKKESTFTCLNLTLQSLPSMKSEPYQCT
ncbi:uncharacterized protein LOC132938174 [Metopolophium dirhodum]|uniref:uncharacterized protein LOC132938174 n=1 Tax=Metopolophium dirhodum TaxID=44670 RepID=UPI00298F521C|nr:uncharacterized protein LOC132938174 [Metopolophium dirhodum]